MNNDMLPVGMTVNVEPEDIKWNGGDRISRSDLKKEVVGMMINKADDLEEVEFEINSALASVCEKIDSAQSVEANWRFYYDHGYKQAERDLKRPKGEWIDRMADKGYVECPFCHKQITGGDLNFCVKCGADMRKKEGNDNERNN